MFYGICNLMAHQYLLLSILKLSGIPLARYFCVERPFAELSRRTNRLDSVSSDDQLHERLDEGKRWYETEKVPGSVLSLKGRDGLTSDLA